MRPGFELKRLGDAGRALMLARRWEQRERWSRERLREHQRRALRGLLARAVADSPFCRRHLGHLPRGVDTPLSELPTLDKSTMMANWDDLVTDRRLRLDAVLEHVGRLQADDYHLGRYRVCATSGSTGSPGVFVWDRREWSTALAAVLRWSAFMDVRPRLRHRVRYAAVGAARPIHQTNRMAATIDVGLMRLLRLEATSPVPALVDALNAFSPEAMNVYPSIGSLLALEQLEGRLRISPRVVCTTSEVRTPEMTDRMRRAWGVEPYDCYGLTEIGIAGADDEHHRGIHVFEDLFILEVVDEQNRPVADGNTGHRCLITNLYNHTQPLIRYEISDLLTLSGEPCPCGRPFALIRRIEGRSDDILKLPATAGGTVAVHPIHLRSPMADQADVRQYQFVHTNDALELSIVLREHAAPEPVSARIRDALAPGLAGLGARDDILRVRVVEQIQRDDTHGAKFKLVRSATGPA